MPRALAWVAAAALLAGPAAPASPALFPVFARVALPLDPDAPRSQARFGMGVAISGDVAAVGAPGENRVHLFAGTAVGPWAHQGALQHGAAGPWDGFGHAVALDGPTLAAGVVHGGYAAVFRHLGSGWVEEAVVRAPDPRRPGWFGAALALDGDRLAVGAPFAPADEAYDGGTVSVHARGPGGWALEAVLTAPEPRTWRMFGHAVALAGDHLLVGEPGPGLDDAPGRSLVFGLGASGWELRGVLEAPGARRPDFAGASVAWAGPAAVVGAPGHDRPGVGPFPAPNAGAVHRFAPAGAGWAPAATLEAPEGDAHDQFGLAVAAAPGLVIVGAPADEAVPRLAAPRGAAYAFASPGGAPWPPQGKVVKGPGGQFGNALALDGGAALVGEPWGWDPLTGVVSGRAHLLPGLAP